MTTRTCRSFPALAGAAVVAALLTGCVGESGGPLIGEDPAASLNAVPCEPTGTGSKPSTISSAAGGPYLVERVVDGDTIRISCNGTSTRVRLVGVNTPETVKDNSPVECGGPEASADVHAILDGGQVFLSADPAQGERDQYDRLLAYVWAMDGSLVNQTILELGHGEATGYGKNYAYKDTFDAAAAGARDARLGLWACPR